MPVKKLKLYESLYIFLRYKQDINFLMEIIIDFNYHNRNTDEFTFKEKTHYLALCNTIILNVCSYLDEYNKHFFAKSEIEFHARIQTVKKIVKPALKKINEWKDLREYRNHMIAHNFRIDGNIFSFNILGQHKAPRTYQDFVSLRKHLMMVHAIIEAEFHDEMPYINPFINSFPVGELKFNYETIEGDLKSVIDKINQLCIENRKRYTLSVDAFMLPN